MDDERPKRHGTVIGDRNESRSHVLTPPRGVGLTQPPIATIRPPAKPATPVVPRREFDFEQKTPPAMDPNTYHALQTMRAEVLTEAQEILRLVNVEVAAREEREAKQAKEEAERQERKLERRRKGIVALVTAVGAAIAGIIAAAAHGCS